LTFDGDDINLNLYAFVWYLLFLYDIYYLLFWWKFSLHSDC